MLMLSRCREARIHQIEIATQIFPAHNLVNCDQCSYILDCVNDVMSRALKEINAKTGEISATRRRRSMWDAWSNIRRLTVTDDA